MSSPVIFIFSPSTELLYCLSMFDKLLLHLASHKGLHGKGRICPALEKPGVPLFISLEGKQG